MTLQEILTGPIAERANMVFHPMTEAEARGILHKFEKQMPKKRRGTVALGLAKHAANGVGNLSQEAIALYRAYATAYGA